MRIEMLAQLVLPFLLAAPATAAPVRRVRFTNPFPPSIAPDADLHLTWTGPQLALDSADYHLDARPVIHGYEPFMAYADHVAQNEPIPILEPGRATWTAPGPDVWPPGTSFIVCVDDGGARPGEQWYDCSDPIPLVAEDESGESEAEAEAAREKEALDQWMDDAWAEEWARIQGIEDETPEVLSDERDEVVLAS